MSNAFALVRWALYADLSIVFGVPAAASLIGARAVLPVFRPTLILTALAGLALSVLGYLLLVSEMAGTPLADLDGALAFDLATGSVLGWAFLARLAALAAAAMLWFSKPRSPLLPTLAAMVAVMSLACSGHAAATDGLAGAVRLVGDMLHLVAAAMWLGALALFATMLRMPMADARRSVAVLARFSSLGSVLVAILIATGLGNLLFLTLPTEWPQMLSTDYGHTLIVKLVLFALMLALAALHRFRLVPRTDVAALRLSVTAELVFGAAVLGCVGLMGTLDPLGM